MEKKIAINSYTNIQDYFLAHWVSVIGPGPAMLYLQLLSYCHKGKDIAWPSIQTLNKRMGITTRTLIRYRHTLIAYGLIKKVVKQRSAFGGYDHNLYQLVILDKERVLLPPGERLPGESEEVVSGTAEEPPCCPEKLDTDEKKSLKKERIIEELKKLKLDKNTISKIILNYSPEDLEEKLDLLKIKRNVINPAGWLVAALQANYFNPESDKREDEEEERKTEEIESERILPPKREKEEIKRLSREEELEWIKKIRKNVLEACQIPKG